MEGFDLRNLLNPEHWIAMDGDGNWFIYTKKPQMGGGCWIAKMTLATELSGAFFSIPKHADWRDSLIQVKDLIKD